MFPVLKRVNCDTDVVVVGIKVRAKFQQLGSQIKYCIVLLLGGCARVDVEEELEARHTLNNGEQF